MHSPINCKACGKTSMEYVAWNGLVFCGTDCLVEFVKRRPTTGAGDLAIGCPFCGVSAEDIALLNESLAPETPSV